MEPSKRRLGVLLVALFTFSVLAAAEQSQASRGDAGPALINWNAPATYTLPRTAHAHPLNVQGGELGEGPSPFFPVTPCRQYDSRPVHGGAGALLQGTPQTIAISGSPCGIPAGTLAASVNITIFDITGATGNGVFKIDIVSPPASAWINYPPTETQRANAGAVSLNASGQLIVAIAQGAGSVDFTIDVNGYYYNGFSSVMPPADYFGIVGSFATGGVIFASNSNSTNLSSGVNATESSTTGVVFGVDGTALSSGAGAAGIRGVETTAAAATSGVLGINGNTSFANSFVPGAEGVTGISAFSGVLGVAENRAVVGVLLDSAGKDLAEGWSGKSGPTPTVFYGIEGILISTAASNGSAGVLGVDNTGSPTSLIVPAGVLGQSTVNSGVVGASGFVAVSGQLYDSTGAFVAEGILGTTFGVGSGSTSGPWAVFANGSFGASGAKHFVEPHPTDPSKVIVYSSIEGPTVDTYFRGTAQTVNHQAVIDVPDHFRTVTDEQGVTVQLTPVGGFAMISVASQDLYHVVVKSTQDVQFHYLIQGVRRAFKDFQPVQTGYEFMPRSPSDRMPAYLTEEAKRRLIANGTYNADGTVNMETAERAGFTKMWADRKAATEEAVKAAAAERAADAAKQGLPPLQ